MRKVLMLAFGLSGLAAISLEVLWTRTLIMVIGGSTVLLALGLFVERNPHKKKGVEKQYSNKRHSDIYFLNKILQITNSHFSNVSSPLRANSRNTIQRATSIVNNQIFVIAGNINKKYPAATLTENAEKTRNLGLVKNLSTDYTLLSNNRYVNN